MVRFIPLVISPVVHLTSNMSTYGEIKSRKDALKIQVVLVQAEAQCNSLIENVQALDKDSPNVRQFRRLEKAFQVELETFQKSVKQFRNIILSTNISLASSSEFTDEVTQSNKKIRDWTKVIDSFNDTLDELEAGDAPAAVTPKETLEALIAHLDENQSRIADTVEKSGKIKNAPRPS